MAARAMHNCGLEAMRLVAPRDGWPNPKAYDAASGADHILDQAKCFDTLKEAVGDLTHLYATTGRRRDMALPAMPPMEGVPAMFNALQAGNSCGILFGGERSGLDNESLSHATAILYFPLNPDFKSLNLSHAVLLVAWEWLRFCQSQTSKKDIAFDMAAPEQPIAPLAQIDHLHTRLMAGIEEGGFFHNIEMKPILSRNLRQLLTRIDLTEQEVRTLHGVIRSLRNAPPQE